jgi:hypothetical protein
MAKVMKPVGKDTRTKERPTIGVRYDRNDPIYNAQFGEGTFVKEVSSEYCIGNFGGSLRTVKYADISKVGANDVNESTTEDTDNVNKFVDEDTDDE